MEYRWIEGDELNRLEPILAQRGWMSLNHNFCRAIIAEENGNIVAFMVFQMIPHCGPMHVDKTYRGTGLPDLLAIKMLEFLASAQCRGFLVIPENQFSEDLCKRFDLEPMTQPVYVCNKAQG